VFDLWKGGFIRGGAIAVLLLTYAPYAGPTHSSLKSAYEVGVLLGSPPGFLLSQVGAK
jgi:hypothetical protein